VVRLAVNDDIEKRVRPVVAQFEEQLASQQALVDRFRVLSPALVVQEALSALSGSGQQRHRHFVNQVAGFHDEWRRFFTQLIVAKAQVTDLTGLPAFVYQDEAASSLRARLVATLATLLVPTVVLAGLAFVRLRRYAVTA
jgi:ABC-2 type transport system permease protein